MFEEDRMIETETNKWKYLMAIAVRNTMADSLAKASAQKASLADMKELVEMTDKIIVVMQECIATNKKTEYNDWLEREDLYQ